MSNAGYTQNSLLQKLRMSGYLKPICYLRMCISNAVLSAECR